MINNTLNTFKGPDAIKDFLNPDNNLPLPLVELPDSLNPYRNKGVRIFAKLMNFLPLNNMKSLPAYNMLMEKDLSGVNTVIENSSGNTVFSLAVIGRVFGIPQMKAIVSHEVSEGKLKLLRLLGTEVIVNEEPICPNPSDPTSGIYKAKEWAKEHGWFNPGQYDNEANPRAHEKWTGPQIWQQTDGKIDILCAGLGTTGTVVGTGKYLKEKNKDIKIVGVTRKANNPVPGVRTQNLLQEVAFNWRDYIDDVQEVGTVKSFKKSLELCRAGLMVGPSSGFALVGLLNYLSQQKFETNEEKIAVFICPDSPMPYLDEYFEFLEKSDFPAIENEYLLKKELESKTTKIPDSIPEITAEETFKIAFADSPEDIWNIVKQKKLVKTNKDVLLVDIRTPYEFEDFHIPNSRNVEVGFTDKQLKNKKLFKGKKVVFICRRGNTSKIATFKTIEAGIDAVSMKGGMTEWSRLNLPRVRADVCIQRFNLK